MLVGGTMHRIVTALAGATALSIAWAPTAFAADMAAPAPMYANTPMAAPAYNWTGFYLGANVGGGWGSRSVTSTPNDPASATTFFLPAVGGTPSPTSFNSSGVLGGMQLGYNWQFNRNWLAGLETDFDGSGMKGSRTTPGLIFGIAPFSATVDEQIKWFGTVRARLGYLPTEHLLTYVTGGLAYGQVAHTGSYFNAFTELTTPTVGGFSVRCLASATCYSGSASSVNTGWTAGAGFEYAVWQNITFKAEYMYVSLGKKPLTETALAVNIPGDNPGSFNANYNRASFNVARVGLNYQFH
jgi:outer membrane immunogenic protein